MIADGDVIIENNVTLTCPECNIRTNGRLFVKGTIKCRAALCKIERKGNTVNISELGAGQGADITITAQIIKVLGTIAASGQGYAERWGWQWQQLILHVSYVF